MPDVNTATIPTQLCPQCKNERPATEFLCLPFDKRCQSCIPLGVQEVIEGRKLKRVEEQMAKLLDLTKGDVVEVPKFDRFLSAFIRDGGGPNQLSATLWRLISELEKKKSHGAAANIISAMLKRWLERERLEHDQDVDRLNRQQVADERQLIVLQILADLAKNETHRELLASLLDASGIGHLAPQPHLEGQVAQEAKVRA